MELIIGFWILCCIFAAVIAAHKGRDPVLWFLVGVPCGPFALLVAALPSLKQSPNTPTPETHVKCPDCAELVLKEAKKCKHCGCSLIPQV